MKHDFDNEQAVIAITPIGQTFQRELQVSKIRAFKPLSENSIIAYQASEDIDDIEEILVVEDCATIAQMINCDPSEDCQVTLSREAIRERQDEARGNIEELEKNYKRETQEAEQEYQSRIREADKALQQAQQNLKRSQDILKESKRAKVIQWLDQRAERRAENRGYYQEPSRLEKTENTFRWVMAIGAVGKITDLAKGQEVELGSTQDWVDRVSRDKDRDKNQKEQAFEREKNRLVNLRDNPGLMPSDRGRLEAKIRDYRIEQGVTHGFRFTAKDSGVYRAEAVRKDLDNKKLSEARERAKAVLKRRQSRNWERNDFSQKPEKERDWWQPETRQLERVRERSRGMER